MRGSVPNYFNNTVELAKKLGPTLAKGAKKFGLDDYANKFKNMYDEGALQEPEDVTEKLFRILEAENFSNGEYIDFNKID